MPNGVASGPGSAQEVAQAGHLALPGPVESALQKLVLGGVLLELPGGHQVPEYRLEDVRSGHTIGVLQQLAGVGTQAQVAEQQPEDPGLVGGVIDDNAVHIENEGWLQAEKCGIYSSNDDKNTTQLGRKRSSGPAKAARIFGPLGP